MLSSFSSVFKLVSSPPFSSSSFSSFSWLIRLPLREGNDGGLEEVNLGGGVDSVESEKVPLALWIGGGGKWLASGTGFGMCFSSSGVSLAAVGVALG